MVCYHDGPFVVGLISCRRTRLARAMNKLSRHYRMTGMSRGVVVVAVMWSPHGATAGW